MLHFIWPFHVVDCLVMDVLVWVPVLKQDVGGVVKVLKIVVKVLEDVRITVVLPLLNVVNVVVNVSVNVEVAWVVVILVHWIVRVD